MAQDYFLSWQEFHRDTRELAERLQRYANTQTDGFPWLGIIGIARGGLIPCAILARELNLRLIDTLCIASYDHQQQGKLTALKDVTSITKDGAGFLLVDDLVDTGSTAKIAKELLPKATLVTVYAKPQGRDLADFYVKEFSQDLWVHFPWDLNASHTGYHLPLRG